MNPNSIYTRSQISDLNLINWETVISILNDKKVIEIADNPKGKSIDYKKFSLIQAVLTYPKIASEGITQVQLDKAHSYAKIIKFNVSNGYIKLKKKKPPVGYLIGHHPGVKNNPPL